MSIYGFMTLRHGRRRIMHLSLQEMPGRGEKLLPQIGNNRVIIRLRKIRGLAVVFTLLPLLFSSVFCNAREVQDSVKIYFRKGYSVLDTSFMDNRRTLDRIADSLNYGYPDSVYTLRRILVVGGASPEGDIDANRRLSEKRADVLFGYLSGYGGLPDSLTSFSFLGCDWAGLLKLVEEDSEVPYREETLEYLHDIVDRCEGGENPSDNNVGRLSRFMGGEPYRYMYRKLFPELRASKVYLWYDKTRNPDLLPSVNVPVDGFRTPASALAQTGRPEVRSYAGMPVTGRPFYMAVKTNMLYDLLLVPNVSAEFYLGRNWSLSAGWMYGWWNSDRIHWYWRTYGGDLGLRRWFGRQAEEKPLTGHHIGIYGQVFTYDFELGGKGYLGGAPGGTLRDGANYAAGIEYGYSLPVAERLNIDFSIGVGYWGGRYYVYMPQNGQYMWEATMNRRWFGPTKAEISLVWLLGRGNTNESY